MLGYLIGTYLIAVNMILFFMMGADKAAAQQGKRRTPEVTLLALAVIGGSAGGVLGMALLRHKTRKPAFRIGLPLILICQLLLAGWLLKL